MGILPIIVLLSLLLVARWSVLRSSVVAWLVALSIAIFAWQTMVGALMVGMVRATVLAVEISLIITGALIFLRMVERFGLMQQMEGWLSDQSADSRVQLILLSWFFGSFLEGTAGFGIPAMIVAPLLASIGYRPVVAIVTALVANTTAVAFGAVGTPIVVGMSGYGQVLQQEISVMTAVLAGLVGLWIPSLLVLILGWYQKQPLRQFVREVLPFSLIAGAGFMIGSVIMTMLLGPELASISGAVVGLSISLMSLRLVWVRPKQVYQVREVQKIIKKKRQLWFLIPYAAFVVLLVVGKLLTSPFIVSWQGQVISINVLNPGLVFLVVAAGMLIWHKIAKNKLITLKLEKQFSLAGRVQKVGLSILFLAGLAQTLLATRINELGLPSMLAIGLEGLHTPAVPLLAPLIGAFGSFMAGSVTMSNIIFAPIQEVAAVAVGISVTSALALQTVGATAGNMISLANIVAVRSVIKTKASEAEIVKKILPWFGVYLGLMLIVVSIIFFL